MAPHESKTFRHAHAARLFGDIYGKGVVVWICPLAPSNFAEVLIWDCERPQQAKGHFKGYEVGANCIVLLIVLSLWEGGVLIQLCSTIAFQIAQQHPVLGSK